MRGLALWLLIACGDGPPEPAPSPAPEAVFTPAPGARALTAVACEPCTLAQRVDTALIRAAGRLADWPGETRFDAAIAVWHIREVVDHPDLARAWERTRAVADKDDDHPHRRFWDETEPKPTNAYSWTEERPPKLNALVAEALWCDRFPMREQTLAHYAEGMRDEGRYGTTHAAFALAEAHSRGCIDDARFEALAAPLIAELLAHQPPEPTPGAVVEVDLFAERLASLLWLGHAGPELEAGVDTLVAQQHADGGWGEASEDQPPYYGYHATFTAAWALAEWHRTQAK